MRRIRPRDKVGVRVCVCMLALTVFCEASKEKELSEHTHTPKQPLFCTHTEKVEKRHFLALNVI